MYKLIISSLDSIQNKTFIQNLTPEETETILAGGYPYGFHIINITDSLSINAVGGDYTIEAAGINSISYHDNRIHTIDHSRSNNNSFFY
ncbi:hypothetical protein NIES2109_16740 [Nostoc sp. HK-01]|uniref:Uncharacterized protein n=1 Tax=Nostoc cycadae WK-1 TaxID=1861711 RepID=A0A2H6LFG1_9NOSO|nr:hypothetical protein NIES2109_16740 [Nostoc sp. HK-01]GBE91955.1 hypothetical protein NCWK1_1708 [Nostoc cycadae WK-1]